jgi:hypothetical protein
MSERQLREFLDGLRGEPSSSGGFTLNPVKAVSKLAGHQSAEAGLWAVKWVQGAVAAGAAQVNFHFSRGQALAQAFGPFAVDARTLVEQFLSGAIPAGRAARHWVAAARGVFSEPLATLSLVSRQGNLRQSALFSKGELALVEDEFFGASPSLALKADRAGRKLLWPARCWQHATAALRSRSRYCPVPILIGREVISQQSPFRQPRSLLCWMEAAKPGEPSFEIHGDPHQLVSPNFVTLKDGSLGLHACALMVTLSSQPNGRGAAEVWWMRDGALIGPVRVHGGCGYVHFEIICPGDHPEVDLSEWALREPAEFFPAERILAVVGRMAQGLESLLQTLSEVDDNQRRGGSHSTPLPPNPKLLRALEGALIRDTHAFSQRTHLELVPG